jgi:Pyruvate/2-oxoacid:ferredoxin oxidoreductase delta subunit
MAQAHGQAGDGEDFYPPDRPATRGDSVVQIYERLARKLDALPSGYPRTESEIELKILEKIFSPEEAALANDLLLRPETATQIADRTGRDPAETAKMLETMTRKGQITGFPMGEERAYMILPFIVGIYFFQVGSIDQELAGLFEEYHKEWSEGVFESTPTHHRVIPVGESIPVDFEVFPYEKAETMLKDAKSFGLFPCMCKLQKANIGEACNHPVMSCLLYSSTEGAYDGVPGIQALSKEEAFKALRDFEDAGLVHTAGNFREPIAGSDYICSCCTCACSFLRALSEYGIENSVAKSNFYAVVAEDACTGCETCLGRCQFSAISISDGVSHVDKTRCTGCGLCVVTCPSKALHLARRSQEEAVHTPRNILEWREERAGARGISMKDLT